MPCTLFLRRLWDGLLFDEIELSNNESAALSKDGRKLEPAVAGFLAWRRGWLLLITPCLLLANVALVAEIVYNFSDRDEYLERFFGLSWRTRAGFGLWPAADHFAAIYTCALASAVSVLVVSVIAFWLTLRALRQWTAYRTSSRLLRQAYVMTFATPFVLLLLFPPVQFVDFRGAQVDLCLQRLQSVRIIRNVARASDQFADELRTTCSLPTDEWADRFILLFETAGLFGAGTDCRIFSTPGVVAQLTGLECVDRDLAENLIDSYATLVSTDVLTASIGLKQGVNTLTTLVPATLGIALGAGKGAMLSKVAAPSLRSPAQLAGFTVMLGVPMQAALFAFLCQLIGSTWISFCCVCLLTSMLVWIPAGLSDTILSTLANLHLARVNPRSNRTSEMVKPLSRPNAVQAFQRRTQMAYAWLALAGVCVLCFLLVHNDYASLLTQAATETIQGLRQANPNSWIRLLVLNCVRAALELLAKTYMAVVVYVDLPLTTLTSIWAADGSDTPEVRQSREQELASFTAALDPPGDQELESFRTALDLPGEAAPEVPPQHSKSPKPAEPSASSQPSESPAAQGEDSSSPRTAEPTLHSEKV